ncbi:LLM class flavin-dependent oxidoreductase [Streptodolium elevatio]|uniref:LLM class flavin-dependent oxidoreductase n=1 Tax=Streptodolium elevatio TaxID=3157996 RepID=A0ABV3DIY2_9ACTN
MEISCALPPSAEAPALIAEAERLGYTRAWCYDSPVLYGDVWMTLALAAERTSTIGLGPAVLVPSLRHPMANAAAIAHLAELAPGRVAVTLGAGFTGRMMLGQRPMPWSQVEPYVAALRALLRGDEILWEGKTLRMLQLPGYGAPRPLSDVPILLGAEGPKGLAAAERLADGVFSVGSVQKAGAFAWRATLQFGTVLEDGEHPTSDRVREAAGPAVAVIYHAVYERAGAGVDGFPGGQVWRESVELAPEDARHLSVHDGHLVALNRHDRLIWEQSRELAPQLTLTGTRDQVRERIEEMAANGVTEIAYQPVGPDKNRELRAFAEAAGIG